MSFQGHPCWYELGTTDLDAAALFYSTVLGWQIIDSGMTAFEYRLARSGGDMVAGLMANAPQTGPRPPHWLIYFAVDDCDATAALITAAGGKTYKAPTDVPKTGRFAVMADPQGAAFGILQPDMTGMSAEDQARARAGEGAFDQSKAGHGNWNELMSSDPEAAFDFYASLFGWSKTRAMDMGEMGLYQLFRHKEAEIGAMMGLGGAPASTWLPYFGVDGRVTDAIQRVILRGGKIHMGPSEVPGPAFIAVAQDAQGAWFVLVGSQR